MNLNKLANEEWQLEHFDGCPAFTEMTGSGFTKKLYDSKFLVYTINISYYSHRQGDWLSLAADHKRVGSFLVKSFMQNPQALKALHKEWQKNFFSLLKFYQRKISEDLSCLSDQELWQWANAVYALYRKVLVPGFIDGYMFYADKRFDKLIKDFCDKNNLSNPSYIFSVLSAPVEPSFINEEEYELGKIYRALKEKGYNRKVGLNSFLKKNKNLLKIIQVHLKKYSWIKSSYLGYKEYLLIDLENSLKEIMKENKKDSLRIFEKHKKEKNKLFKKYKFNKEILAIAEITEILVKWQDERKNYNLTFFCLQEKIIMEVQKRTNIDLELLRYCQINDIKLALENRLNIGELKARQAGSIFVYKGGKVVEIFSGKTAKDFFKKVSRIKIDSIKEFKGMSASLGKAIGSAKIIHSINDLDKVKKKDVLVAAMTRPEHLLAMKKAAAIVTDDGGITCHAAIVSRELKKPCIIGTKIATKVLKDGDLVEVDANKGIIKVLNKF